MAGDAYTLNAETLGIDAARTTLEAVGQTYLERRYLGDGLGTVTVSGKPGYAYVHDRDPDGDVRSKTWALNPLGLSQHGMPVIVGRTPRSQALEIIAIDRATMAMYFQDGEDADTRVVANHGLTHNLFGGDAVIISAQQVEEFSVHPTNPQSLYVRVHEGLYWNGATLQHFAGSASADLSSYVPAGSGDAVWVLLSFNANTAALNYTAGAEFTATARNTDTYDNRPYADLSEINLTLPANHLPLSVVYLAEDTTAIGWEHIFRTDLAALQPNVASVTGWAIGAAGRSEIGETTYIA